MKKGLNGTNFRKLRLYLMIKMILNMNENIKNEINKYGFEDTIKIKSF